MWLDWIRSRFPALTWIAVAAVALHVVEVLLTAAAQDRRVQAVVAEGTQARTIKELGLLPLC
jgi:hypothetical protein